MRLFKYLATKIIIASVVWFAIASCGKNMFDTTYAGYDGKVYMPQAAEGRNNFALPLSSKPWRLGFGAGYGGAVHAADKDIPVQFALKEDLITTYNRANGTSYIPLPAGSYTISGLNSIIRKGNTTSDSLNIIIDRRKLDLKKKYMFPITLVSASSEKIDSALQTTWFRIDTIIRSERDATAKGTLSVSNDNSGGADAGEGSKKLVDNNIDTKFLVFNINDILPNFWYQLTFPTPIVLGAYTITSANDAPERDPKDWKLQGSNDLTNWTVLDTKAGQSFSARKFTIRYEFNNNTAYKYYRMTISAINGATLFQQAEWRVIEFYEE